MLGWWGLGTGVTQTFVPKKILGLGFGLGYKYF